MKVLIDTDPGHDDALAIILAARHCEIVGITTVAGNQSLDKVTRNALTVVELIGKTDIPIAQGAERPLIKAPRHAPLAHGESGLDGHRRSPPSVETIGRHAVDFLIDTFMSQSDISLVTLGPLTNVALALRRQPRLAQRIPLISMMGGSTTFGNVTAAAEFNVWFDPEAAQVVFSSGIPIRMCGLNLTHQVIAAEREFAAIRAMAGNPVAMFCADLLAFYADPQRLVSGAGSGAWHDPCAVAALIDPTLIEFLPMHVAVELKGALTYGQTVCDARHLRGIAYGFPTQVFAPRGEPANAEVAVRIDRDRFFGLFLRTLADYCGD